MRRQDSRLFGDSLFIVELDDDFFLPIKNGRSSWAVCPEARSDYLNLLFDRVIV